MAITGASLSGIYDRLNETQKYNPMEADTFADWATEAGDTVSMKQGSDEYAVPLHSMRMVWKGQPKTTLSATGQKQRDALGTQSKNAYRRGSAARRNVEELHHYIDETDEHWESMYWDGYNGLSGRITQTAAYWQAEYEDMYNGLVGFVEITAEHFETEYADLYNGLSSRIEQTAAYWQAEYEDMYNGLVGFVEITAQHFETEYADLYNGLSSRIEQTAAYWQAEYQDMYNGLVGFVEITAEHFETEFSDMYNGLTGYVEATAQHWESELNDTYNGLSGRIEQTAAYWQAEFVGMYNGLVGFVEITDEHWQTTFTDSYNGLVGYVEATADHWESQIANVYSGLSSRVEQTENSWSATVQAIGYNGVINAGTIALSINNAGESEAHIDANKVYIGNSKSTTVINGKCSLSDVTASYIQAQIASLASLNVARLTSERGGVDVYSVGTTSFTQGGVDCYVPHAITSLRITQSGNTYTLQRKWFSEDEWTDVGSFSRATTLSGEWSGRNYVVTATPQGDIKIGTVYDAISPDYDSETGKVEYYKRGSSHFVKRKHYVYSEDPDTGDADSVILHKDVEIPADLAYNAGFSDGSASGGTTTLLSSWDGAKFTVTASPQGVELYRVLSAGSAIWDGRIASIPISAVYGDSGQYTDGVVFAPTVDATPAYNSGWGAAYGKVSVPTGSNTGGSISVGVPPSTVDGTTDTYTYAVSADDNYAYIKYGTTTVARASHSAYSNGYDSAHVTGTWSTVSSASRDNKLTISKTTSGSSDSVWYIIAAAATVVWDPTNSKYTATGQAKVDGTVRGSDATASTGALSISFSNLQGSGASGYRIAYLKEGTTTRITSGNITDYGDGYSAGYSSGDTAGQTTGYNNAHLSGTFSGTNNQTLTISKVKTGSANSLTYTIGATAGISWNSSTNKFVATGQAKIDTTARGAQASASSGAITIAFNNLQGSGASAYRTVSVKEGSTVRLTSGNLTDYGDGYSAGNSAGQTTGYNNAHVTGTWSTVSSASRNNKLTISKTTSGSANSLEYVIAAGASIAWDSTNKKYTATGQAKVDGTVRGSDATASSGVLSISFGNLQGSGASGYRVAYIKEGTTTRVTSGNITDYGDGYSAGNSAGYNTGYSEGNSAGQTTGYNNARISVTFSGTNNQTMSIAKVSTGSLNSISYTIGATSGISWDSTNKKYTATAQAKLDSTNRGSASSSSSGALSLVFNNLQGSGASAYRTVSLKEGSTVRLTSGNLTDYGDGYSAGNTAGYNGAKMSGSWSGSTLSISKGTSGSTSLSYTVSAGVTFGYDTTNKCYNIYGTAYVDSTTRASASGTTGMEAAEDGVLRAISRTVTFVGSSQQSNYNSRINTITANGTYYSCAVGPDSYWGTYGHNGSWSSTYYAGNTRSFTVNVPTSASYRYSATLNRAITSVSSSGTSTGAGKLYFYNSMSNVYALAGPSSNQYWYYSSTGISSGKTVHYN